MEEERQIKGYDRTIKSSRVERTKESEQDKQYVLLDRNKKKSNKEKSSSYKKDYNIPRDINTVYNSSSDYATVDETMLETEYRFNSNDNNKRNGITFEDTKTLTVGELIKKELGDKKKERKDYKDSKKKTYAERGVYSSGKKHKEKDSFGAKFVVKSLKKGASKVKNDTLAPAKDSDKLKDDSDSIERRKAMRIAVFILVKIISFASTLVSNLLLMLGVEALAVIVVVLLLMVGTTNITYNFIVDENKFIRDHISSINMEFVAKQREAAAEQGCSKIIMYGNLTDWKDIVAFWWTVKSRSSDTMYWKDFWQGEDYDMLHRLFYEFNEISTSVASESSTSGDSAEKNKVYKITINNKSLESMMKEYKFSNSQQTYIKNLMAEEKMWKEILGASMLGRFAWNEYGCTSSKYKEWFPLEEDSDWNLAFVEYCLEQCGYMSDYTVKKTNDMNEFSGQLLKSTIFSSVEVTGEEGDLIFLDYGNDKGMQVGIITRVQKDYYELVMGDYSVYDSVSSLTIEKDIEAIKGIVRLTVPNVQFDEKRSRYTNYGGKYLWPTPENYIVTSHFGPRWGTHHAGMDIACPEGSDVIAIASGEVVLSQYSSSAGNYIIIKHEDVSSVYMHNSELLVNVGDQVNAGDIIAKSGTTGNSTGPHCHLEIRIEGDISVNPAPYYNLPDDFMGNAEDMLKSNDELKLLATTLATEGQPGSYESMMAVGTIIMNRVESDGYPDTLEEVIYQPMQFEATWLHPNFKQYLNLGAPNLANEVARDLLQGKRDPRLIMPKCTQFRTDKPYYRSQYPNGISIGGNWYFW